MNITIFLGDIQHDVLEQFAKGNSITPEQYAANILAGWINSHIRGYYEGKIKNETFDNLEAKFGKVKI